MVIIQTNERSATVLAKSWYDAYHFKHMRYDTEHKQQTHERILTAAAKLFRREGFSGASVDRVMKAAGLTVGGFYAHFDSKQALLIESLQAMLRQRWARWLEGLEDLRGNEFLEHLIRRYLSRIHRDTLDDGCPLPATLSELTRADPEVRKAFAEELETLVAEISSRLPRKTGRAQALAAISQAFGGLMLARATLGTELSDEFLDAGRKQFAAK